MFMEKNACEQCNEAKVGEAHGFAQKPDSLFGYLVRIPQKFQNSLKEHYRQFRLHEHRSGTGDLPANESQAASIVSFEKQMKAWWDNPDWQDVPPEVNVTVPKGSLCNINLNFKAGIPPDAIFDILTDPGNMRVFKSIKEVIARKVVVDEGSRQVVEVEQAATWKFLWLSGTLTLHLYVDQDRENHTIKFRQGRRGFMERFEGAWKIDPLFVDEELCVAQKPMTLDEYNSCTGGTGRVGSSLTFTELLQPSLLPPPPISWYIRGITAKTTETMIQDIFAEAARLRSLGSRGETKEGPDTSSESNNAEHSDFGSIKARWRSRRGTARNRICFR